MTELLLREPEIVAWLDDYRPEPPTTPKRTTSRRAASVKRI